MTQEIDLLRTIAREPDDDAPRLVYADWLDDNDRPERAEFIRGQVRLAGMVDDSPQRRELAFRCRQLLDAHEEEWNEQLPGLPLEWHWSRGFVEMIDIDPEGLVEEGAELFERFPIRRLVLADLCGDVDLVGAIPEGNRLTALDLIGDNIDLRALKKLVKFTHLGGLTELGLMFNRLRDSAVKFLCEEPFFQDLSLIRLGCNPFSNRGRERLRDHFGDCVSFARERFPDRLYAIQDDRLVVGWGRDHTQLVLCVGEEDGRVALFDHAGNLLRIERRAVPQESDDPRTREARRAEVRDAWLAELGYQSATIKVKRFTFEPDWGGVYDFPDMWCDEFDRPNSPEIDSAREWLEGWLADDKFAWGQGLGDMWFDRKSGEVTDT
jgi:uncharacterized protein (TIGR02996 family)